jgi:hypothetical protein
VETSKLENQMNQNHELVPADLLEDFESNQNVALGVPSTKLRPCESKKTSHQIDRKICAGSSGPKASTSQPLL